MPTDGTGFQSRTIGKLNGYTLDRLLDQSRSDLDWLEQLSHDSTLPLETAARLRGVIDVLEWIWALADYVLKHWISWPKVWKLQDGVDLMVYRRERDRHELAERRKKRQLYEQEQAMLRAKGAA